MKLISLVFIAFGLAMDAFAVSITSGITLKKLKVKKALKIGSFFGFFQAFLPLIGWFSGRSMRYIVKDFDHWVAFVFLAAIGIKMIYESTSMKEEEERMDPSSIYVLLLFSIATSIDALVVGMTFSFLDIDIITPVILIGFITFTLTFIGVYIGDKFGHFFENKIEAIGGAILILIGIKILMEHIFL